MAIVVEEERKNGGGVLSVVVWLLLLVALATGGYYLFFEKPDLIEVAVPSDFKSTEQISKINLDPDAILALPQFKALRPYVTLPPPPLAGRSNPFLGF